MSGTSTTQVISQNSPPLAPLIPPAAPATDPSATILQTSPAEPSAKVQILELQVGYLKDQIKILEEKFSNYLLIVSAVFAAVFAFFGVIPFITGKAAERRAQESHNLAIRGESGSQQRATEVHQTFLADSKNTLELVNATLQLAKDASERAATIIQARAEKLLKELDRSAKKMLAEAKDDRDLVTNPQKKV